MVQGGLDLSGGHLEINDSYPRGEETRPLLRRLGFALLPREPRGLSACAAALLGVGGADLPSAPRGGGHRPRCPVDELGQQDAQRSVFASALKSEVRVWAETEGVEIVDANVISL